MKKKQRLPPESQQHKAENPTSCWQYVISMKVQGRSLEETTTEANARSVVRNQPYEIF